MKDKKSLAKQRGRSYRGNLSKSRVPRRCETALHGWETTNSFKLLKHKVHGGEWLKMRRKGTEMT